MDKIYRIGSFNLRNIGKSAFTNSRNLEKIADIIKEFDIIALQEVLSEGKVFTEDDLPSRIVKKNILNYLPGGAEHWGFSWAYSGDESNRHEGYAFVWNKDRLDMPEVDVIKNGKNYKRVFCPRMISINHEDMDRRPYYGRFSAQGKVGGSNFEIRLICVHTHFGKDLSENRAKRQKELDVLLQDVYPQIEDRVYKDRLTNYTILLGDYNAELVIDKIRNGYEERNAYRREQNIKIPMVMRTDSQGEVYSNRYKRNIKTVQYELTTLKKKVNETTGEEEFADRGYASNYDHFSYDESRLKAVLYKQARRVDVVNDDKTFNGDFEAYYNTVSDHIPIAIELKIN